MITARRIATLSSVSVAAVLTAAVMSGAAQARFGPDSVTIDPTGRIAKNGVITLSGSYRCSSPGSGPVLIGARAVQGDARADADGAVARCDGRVHTWRESGRGKGTFVVGGARGEATLLRLDTSRSFVPLPVILGSDRTELKLRRN
ncbi:DUF6299 family protein [Streptomyces sp. NPDC055078]